MQADSRTRKNPRVNFQTPAWFLFISILIIAWIVANMSLDNRKELENLRQDFEQLRQQNQDIIDHTLSKQKEN